MLQQQKTIHVGNYGIYDYAGFYPEFLLGLLNSSFITYYAMNKFRYKHLSDGYLAINKHVIEQVPVVEVSRQQPPLLN